MTTSSLARRGPWWRSARTSRWGPSAGWTTFDMATSMFSLNVSVYLSQWVVNDAHGSDATWALAVSVSTLVVVLVAPILGAVSDESGRRMPFLIAVSVVIACATALLGLGGLAVTLLVFGAANVAYLCGNVFYNALLPSVSTDANRGRIGGIAAALGAFGSLLGIAVGLVVLSGNVHDKPTLFRISAAMFAVFALPCLLLVRDQSKARLELGARQMLLATRQVASTIAHVRQYEGLGAFLVARCLYTIALSTIGVFLAIYVVDEVGFSVAQMQVLTLIALLTAVGGSIVWGKVVDRLGPKRGLDVVLVVWGLVFAATAFIAYAHLPRAAFWGVGALTGLALGGAPTADRPFLIRLSPPRLIGELYGLYATVGLLAAVVGPLLWTLVANGLGLGRPAAIVALLVCVLLALLVLRIVNDAPRTWPAHEAADPPRLPHRELEPFLDQSLPPTSREARDHATTRAEASESSTHPSR